MLLLALTRASGFHVRFCWRHHHLLVGEQLAQQADASNGHWLAPEQGADGQPPAEVLHWQFCCHLLLHHVTCY